MSKFGDQCMAAMWRGRGIKFMLIGPDKLPGHSPENSGTSFGGAERSDWISSGQGAGQRD